ncbi:ArsR/SmtB family transcription factor [Nonomuraea basaltis]|uniref:ArsR/SmtB family transcription factor n=1 Tax=Nonomuraea basaltis TaxID=2495887 RepID=UPI00110C6369|nr:helix-turn-helix domain-containing protein [Nonomuraea basaltis]TMR98335.1 ArsR family transcriptional regulator [Nonomuraea basaltis]
MRITDPRAIRALAHPLRLDLIDLLGRIGPATATTCAKHLDTSQASCSFHLRQLAKYGYVTEAEPSEDKRERLWQLTDHEQKWSRTEGGPAAMELERVFIEREAARMAAWTEARTSAAKAWQDAAFVSGVSVPLTPEELDAIGKEFMRLLEPYIARLSNLSLVPGDASSARIFLHGAPHAPLDT